MTLIEALVTIQNCSTKEKEALGRSLGNYLYLKANFSLQQAELEAEDMSQILGRMINDAKVIRPLERGRNTSNAQVLAERRNDFDRQMRPGQQHDRMAGVAEAVEEALTTPARKPLGRMEGG